MRRRLSGERSRLGSPRSQRGPRPLPAAGRRRSPAAAAGGAAPETRLDPRPVGRGRPLDRQRDRDDQRHAVEHVVQPAGAGHELQALHADGQDVDRQQRAPDVEPPGDQLRRAEEGGGERRKQEGPAEVERRPVQRGEHDARAAGDGGRGHERERRVAVDPNAGQTRGLGVAADRVQVAAGRRVRGQPPQHERDDEQVQHDDLEAADRRLREVVPAESRSAGAAGRCARRSPASPRGSMSCPTSR